MGAHTFRNRQGDLVEIPEVAAMQAKNTFGDLLDRLQTPEARRGLEAAFNASPEELGRAAVEIAKRRR
ncbi:MAG TPA: hypothetical protein VGM86_20900 [Thermoanaerobaculia bacterium]|jgi:hypothetical protein